MIWLKMWWNRRSSGRRLCVGSRWCPRRPIEHGHCMRHYLLRSNPERYPRYYPDDNGRRRG